MNRIAKFGAAAVACGLSSLPGASVWACGGGGVTSRVGVTTNAQRIFMSVRATGTTDIVAQIAVPQTTADYGVLIPVPDEPTLDDEPVSAEELNALDNATAPKIFVQTGSSGSSGSGCGCLGAGAGDDDSAGTKGPSRGVTVSSEVTIGPVLAVSLTGDSGDAVRAWLTDNGFSLPQDDTATLDRYVGAGKYFIAIRRKEATSGVGASGGVASGGAATGGATSIGIHYTLPGDHRMLSLGFTRIGAAPKLAITLFLAAPQIVGPSEPFKALTLDALDAAVLRDKDYALALESAVAAHDSKAFVLEGSRPFGGLASSMPKLAALVDSDAVLTRATTILPRDRIEDDAVFATQFKGDVPSYRVVSLGAAHARYAGMGSLALLLVAGGLRRRSRGRVSSAERYSDVIDVKPPTP